MDDRHIADFGFDPVHRTVWVELDDEPGRDWAARLARHDRGTCRGSMAAVGRHVFLHRPDIAEIDMLSTLVGIVAETNAASGRRAHPSGP